MPSRNSSTTSTSPSTGTTRPRPTPTEWARSSQLAYQRKIRELAGAGTAVLLASNQVDEVEALCDRVAFLHKGSVISEGTPEDLVSSLRGVKRIVATLRNPVEYA